MRLIIPRRLLNDFRAECRKAYPYETMAALFGSRMQDGVEITAIVHIPHTAKLGEINHGKRAIPNSKIKALYSGADWLGTIHSHCQSTRYDTCGHPSESDIKSALENGESIMAIVYVFEDGTRTEVSWYKPVRPIDIQYKER
jgi:proteasome lid subunit RPN8/RPN11